MKIKHISVYLLLLLSTVSACKKNAVQVIDNKVTGSYFKFFNFAVSSPDVNLYANTTEKLTASLSNTGAEVSSIAVGGLFPVNQASYGVLNPGNTEFSIKTRSNDATYPNTTLASASFNIEAGKKYSIFQLGIFDATTKKTDAYIIEDKIPAQDTSKVYVRLVNILGNATQNTFKIKETTTNVETELAKSVGSKTSTEFIAIPAGTYHFNCYNEAGALVFDRKTVSLTKGRVYTITAFGDIKVISTTLANRARFDLTVNL